MLKIVIPAVSNISVTDKTKNSVCKSLILGVVVYV
jgi:hypothetical protein